MKPKSHKSKKLNVKHPKRNPIKDNQQVTLTMDEANDGLKKLGCDGKILYNYVKDHNTTKNFEKKIKKAVKHKMDTVRRKFK